MKQIDKSDQPAEFLMYKAQDKMVQRGKPS